MNKLEVSLSMLTALLLMCYFSYRASHRKHRESHPIYNPSRKKWILPEFIRKYFKLKKEPLTFSIWFRFIHSYSYVWLTCLTALLAIFLPYDLLLDAFWAIIIFAFGLSGFLLIIFDIIEAFQEIPEYQKAVKTPPKKEKGFLQELKTDWNTLIILSELKEHKKWEPLRKDIQRCMDRKHTYIPAKNVKHIEAKVLGNYLKTISYEFKTNEEEKEFLFVYAKADGHLVFQAEIRK